MRSQATRVVVYEHNQVAVLREHGRRSYFALVGNRRVLKRRQRSLGRACLYRTRVLARLGRRRRYERSLRGRLRELGRWTRWQ